MAKNALRFELLGDVPPVGPGRRAFAGALGDVHALALSIRAGEAADVPDGASAVAAQASPGPAEPGDAHTDVPAPQAQGSSGGTGDRSAGGSLDARVPQEDRAAPARVGRPQGGAPAGVSAAPGLGRQAQGVPPSWPAASPRPIVVINQPGVQFTRTPAEVADFTPDSIEALTSA